MRRFLVSCLAVSAFWAANASAATVATVNIQDVLKQSNAAKSINSQIEQRRGSYQTQVTQKEEELRKMDQELAKQRSVLAPEAFQQKQKEFKTKVTDAQRDVQQKKIALDQAYGRALSEIQKRVQQIVSDLATEKNFEVAIATNQLLYAKTSLDITADVITRLNSALPDVKVNVEAAPKQAPKAN